MRIAPCPCGNESKRVPGGHSRTAARELELGALTEHCDRAGSKATIKASGPREDILALPQVYPADAFLTLYHQGHPAAAALLTDADPLFWPQAAPGTSGYLHKLSVRRAYAGQGLAQRLICLTGILCNNEGKSYLRLDCDASRQKLIALYQSAGFTCLGVRAVQTRRYGTVRAALFRRALA